MKVSEAALKLAVPRHYIDYWRKTGLLTGLGPERPGVSDDPGDLSFQDLVRIRLIASFRKQGLSLQRIRRIVENEAEADWHNRLSLHGSGTLLRKDQGRLLHPETGQLYFRYEGDGKNSGDVRPLHPEPSGEGGFGEDPAVLGLEERYLKVLGTGNFRLVSQVLEEIIREKPDHVAALIEFGNLCFEHHKTADALHYYERALELYPDCVEALYNVANIHFKEKRYAAAIRYFQSCIELDPEFPEAYYNLGLLYYSLKYFEQALECFEHYAALDEDSTWTDQARQIIEDIRQAVEGERNHSLFE